ncbi:hypothetical protein NQ318_006946 [Aromia moschata]|uniref:DDE-1 domain-containing protein n=1 Tax=Aromia moschata TaxID=1265417 RepID=A0AAV8Y6X1_9CUCU|nr:hypothetical protein NQ318_006946 [Aromia moschata]
MDRNVFIDWYKNVFIPSVKKRNLDPEEKFILILDNAPAHPSSTELNEIDPQFFVVYLAPNVTSLIQLMYQGVISHGNDAI